MVSLIYILSTRVYSCFIVHKLAKFSINSGKVHFEVLLDLLKCIMVNKNLGLKYYSKIEDSPISDLFRPDSIET